MPAIEIRAPGTAFTTVEMLAALFLAGLLAALTTLSLAGPLRAEQLRDLMNRLAFADAMLREQARAHHRPTRIVFDTDHASLLDPGAPPGRTMFRLPAGWELDRLVVAGHDESPDSSNGVAISATGRSPSYAVRFTHNDRTNWIAVNGVTGRLTECDDEFQANHTINPTGHDAD